MEKIYTNLLYSLQQNQIPINKGKKTQIKVQAENSKKSNKERINFKSRKENRFYAVQNRSKLVYRKENRFYAVQNRSTYNKMERKKETKTSLPTVPD